MEIHRRKKIEIVVESGIVPDVVEWLTSHAVKGYTTVPKASGFGRQGHRRTEEISGVFENTLVIAIASEETARRILAESVERFRDYAAIVYLSDVEVARPDHF
jgi:nitrogen regulatory protein PII